jgi:hypothetical protein
VAPLAPLKILGVRHRAAFCGVAGLLETSERLCASLKEKETAHRGRSRSRRPCGDADDTVGLQLPQHLLESIEFALSAADRQPPQPRPERRHVWDQHQPGARIEHSPNGNWNQRLALEPSCPLKGTHLRPSGRLPRSRRSPWRKPLGEMGPRADGGATGS